MDRLNFALTKRGILLLSVLTLLLFAIGVVLTAVDVRCTAGATSSTASCTSGPAGVLANVFYFFALLLMMGLWVLGMVKTGTARRWGWFAAFFLVPPLAGLAYGVFGPADPSHTEPSVGTGAEYGRRYAS